MNLRPRPTHRRVRACLAALCLAVAPFAAPEALAQASPIEMTSIAQAERTVRKPDGSTAREKLTVKSALPGDEVVFLNRFRNVGDKPAANLVLTNPLPEHTRLKDVFGTAALVTFSVDGGKTYDVAEKLTVAGADGKSRPAAREDYTHIRWQMSDAMAPGQTGEVGFRVAVK